MSLEAYRKEIDAIDTEMRELFIKRMEVATKIGLYKKERNLPIFQPGREAELIEKRSEGVPEELKVYYKEFLQDVMNISKERQAEVTEIE